MDPVTLENVVLTLIKVLDSHHKRLCKVLRECSADFTRQMFDNSFTTQTVRDAGGLDQVMSEFKACFSCCENIHSLEKMCSTFLNILCGLKGPPARAAFNLKKDWRLKMEREHQVLAFLQEITQPEPGRTSSTPQNLVSIPPPKFNHSAYSDGHLSSHSSNSYRLFIDSGPGREPCSEESLKMRQSDVIDSPTDVGLSVQAETESCSSADIGSNSFHLTTSSRQSSIDSSSQLYGEGFQQSFTTRRDRSNLSVESDRTDIYLEHTVPGINNNPSENKSKKLKHSMSADLSESELVHRYKKKKKKQEKQLEVRYQAEVDGLKQQLHQTMQELAQIRKDQQDALTEKSEELTKKRKAFKKEKQEFYNEKVKFQKECDQLKQDHLELEQKSFEINKSKKHLKAKKYWLIVLLALSISALIVAGLLLYLASYKLHLFFRDLSPEMNVYRDPFNEASIFDL